MHKVKAYLLERERRACIDDKMVEATGQTVHHLETVSSLDLFPELKAIVTLIESVAQQRQELELMKARQEAEQRFPACYAAGSPQSLFRAVICLENRRAGVSLLFPRVASRRLGLGPGP